MKKKVYLSIVCALALNLSAADLGEIQVESSTIQDNEGSLKTEVSTVNTINAEKYEIVDPKNFGEVLKTIPGITADVRNGETVEIHIRGVGQQEFMWENTGVAVVIDGVPMLQNGGKVKINLDNIQSIKVIKGGASYLYGSDALAGAVIITTKKPKNKNFTKINAEYGSYNYQNYVATLNHASEQYALTLTASRRSTDGYWDMSSLWTNSINGRLTYYIDDMSDITAGIEVTKKYEESSRGSVTGVTAAETNPTGAGDADLPWNHDYDTDIQKYFLTYNKDFSNGSNLMVNGYYYIDNYAYEASPQDLSGDGVDDTYTRDSTDDISQYGFKSEYKGNIEKFAYMLGIDIGQRELKSDDLTTTDYSIAYRGDYYAGENSSSDSTENRYGFYGELKYALTKKLTAVANARYDYQKYTYNEDSLDYNGSVWSANSLTQDKSFNNMSYRVGLAYQANKKTTLYTNISTGFRNPRVQDLFAGDFDPDGDYMNNPNLDTETTINYEIGIRGNQKIADTAVKYELSVYQLNTKNIISKIGGTYYSNGTNLYYDNVGDARTRGLELSLNTDKKKMLAFDLAYTYMRAVYTSHKPFTVDLSPTYRATGDETYYISGNELPRTPNHRIDFFTYLHLSKNWKVIAENYWQSSYYADETNFVKMDAYSIMNLQVRYNTKIKKNPFEIYLKVDNIFDNQYYRTVYLFSDKSGDGTLDAEDASITVDPGRVLYAGIKYKF